MQREMLENRHEPENQTGKKNAGPSTQPWSFWVLSSRSTSLSKSLWSLLTMVLLLLPSLFPFFSCTGDGFTVYKNRDHDEFILCQTVRPTSEESF